MAMDLQYSLMVSLVLTVVDTHTSGFSTCSYTPDYGDPSLSSGYHVPD